MNFINNIIITDLNSSPIKDSKYISTISEDEASRLINNSYISSLFEKRENYKLYKCNPNKLISKYRYDVYIKYFYVKCYIEDKNYILAKKIYIEHIRAFNNFYEPDGSKTTPNDFIENFNKLIESIKNEGISKTIIPVSKTGIPIDGAHRLAICLYFNLDVPFVVFDLLDGKYDREFFMERGLNLEFIRIIDKVIRNKGWL